MYFKPNVSTQCDFYKIGHKAMYHDKMTCLYSNLTCRNDKYADMLKASPFYNHKVVVFGVQLAVKDFLINSFNDGFFNQPKYDVLAKYKQRMDSSLGKDSINIDHIAKLHDLGYLPIEVKAIDEGSVVDLNVPLVTIVNTHPDFAWLVNYLETTLLNTLWKPLTVATVAHEYKKVIAHYAELTSDNLGMVDFLGHDFSMRGQNNVEDAMVSGAAFLTSFKGTDSIASLDLLEEYYGVDSAVEAAGYSVGASEHSVMTSLILYKQQQLIEGGFTGDALSEAEYLVYKDLLEQYPTGILSLVSDQFDYWGVLSKHLPRLKDIIMARDGKLVVRPDTGHMPDVVCGLNYIDVDDKLLDDKLVDDEDFEYFVCDILAMEVENHSYIYDEDTISRVIRYENKLFLATASVADAGPNGFDVYDLQLVELTDLSIEDKGSIEALWDIFGGTVNSKGYKELDPHIGLIIGDGNTIPNVLDICKRLTKKGFAATNVVYGIGAYSLNGLLTRDTFGQAFKSTYCEIDGNAVNIYKDPKTDASKKSAKGLLCVGRINDTYTLYDQQTWQQESTGELATVFKDGKLIKETTLAEIRSKLAAAI